MQFLKKAQLTVNELINGVKKIDAEDNEGHVGGSSINHPAAANTEHCDSK